MSSLSVCSHNDVKKFCADHAGKVLIFSPFSFLCHSKKDEFFSGVLSFTHQQAGNHPQADSTLAVVKLLPPESLSIPYRENSFLALKNSFRSKTCGVFELALKCFQDFLFFHFLECAKESGDQEPARHKVCILKH